MALNDIAMAPRGPRGNGATSASRSACWSSWRCCSCRSPLSLSDLGLAFSIAFVGPDSHGGAVDPATASDFSSFPTILLIATMMRLSLNIATNPP